jgi:hypothetical protein
MVENLLIGVELFPGQGQVSQREIRIQFHRALKEGDGGGVCALVGLFEPRGICLEPVHGRGGRLFDGRL